MIGQKSGFQKLKIFYRHQKIFLIQHTAGYLYLEEEFSVCVHYMRQQQQQQLEAPQQLQLLQQPLPLHSQQL